MRIRSRHLTVTIATMALAATGGVITASPASAATSWWVDNTAANCSNSGPGTADTPLCTISAGASRAVGAGDTVNVRAGAYAEQVTVAGSGASGAPISFVAAAPGVTVIGTRDLSTATWTATSGGTWSTPYSPPSAPRQVFVDGKRLLTGASASGLASGSFYYSSVAKQLYVNIGGPTPQGHAVLAGAQTYGFNVLGRTNVAIRGFTLSGQNSAGVRISGGSAVAVAGVSSVDSGVNGILIEGSSSNIAVTGSTVDRAASVGIKLKSTTGSTIQANTVTRSGNHGISLSSASGNLIEGNESADNVVTSGSATASGIDVNTTSTDTVVRGNLVRRNQDSGIQIYNGSDRALVVRNVSHGNNDHGFDTQEAIDVRYVSNTAYGNRNDGFSIEGLSTGASLRNNISVDNGLATGSHDLYIEQTSMTGFTSDSDLIWNSVWLNSIKVGYTRYRTLADFATTTGNEASGRGQDPMFIDAGAGDLRLAANSPAIDSADASVSGFEGNDRAGTAPANDPNVPDTGQGTPTFADRGALERVPAAGDPAEHAPHAVLTLSRSTGEVPPAVSVTADATGSSDADSHGIATYTFDFGDGTTVGPQTSGTAAHKYVTSGAHTVTVTVTDTGGAAGSAQRTVSLSDRPLITHHVDTGNASCSDTGPGSTAVPYCTISKAAAVALAGDTVAVEAGDYLEQVTPTYTGMAGAPLTFRANGAARVIGTTDLSTPQRWTATSTSAWRTSLTSPSPVTQVFLNGIRLSAAASATTTTTNSFFHDGPAATLYVDVGGGNPGAAGTVAASTRTYGFKLWKADTVVVDGFTTVGQNGVGVSVQDSAGVVVSGSSIQSASSHGISSDRSTGTRVTGSTSNGNGSIGIRIATTSGAVVSSNTVHHNGFHGISVQSSTGASVAGNTSYGNAHRTTRVAAGIDISSSSTGAVVQRNTTYANQDSGIQIYGGSNNATVRRNITYDNGDHGIDCLSSTGDRVVGNTVVGNVTAGINLEGGCSAATVANNISVDNAVASPATIGNIRLDEASSPGSTVDRNLVFMANGGPLYEWFSDPYMTVESFRGASGQGGTDIGLAPGFVDLAGRDLALTISSPAIDNADLSMSGAASADHDGVDPVDVASVPNSGAGNPAYADRGALEYRGS